jgi:hypothetical protein
LIHNLLFASWEVCSVALFHKLAYGRVKLRLREEFSELNVLGDGISHEVRRHDLSRLPSDEKTSDALFDEGYATFSVIVPFVAWMVPLGKERAPPGLQQADLSSKRRIKLTKALNLMKTKPDL